MRTLRRSANLDEPFENGVAGIPPRSARDRRLVVALLKACARLDDIAQSNRPLVWTFERGREWVEIRREEAGDGALLLVVSGDHALVGSTAYVDVMALIRQQNVLEATLLAGGWSLTSFAPERRTGVERRTAKRETLDRRRWWTDSAFRNEP